MGITFQDQFKRPLKQATTMKQLPEDEIGITDTVSVSMSNEKQTDAVRVSLRQVIEYATQ